MKTNVVADGCSATLDLRTVPGQNHDEILAEVEQALSEACSRTGASYEIRITNDKAPVATSESEPFIELSLDLHKDISGGS